MNILLNETSLREEKIIETIIKIRKETHTFHQYFQYCLTFLNHIIKTIIKNRNHTHSRNNAGNEVPRTWIQYTNKVDRTW